MMFPSIDNGVAWSEKEPEELSSPNAEGPEGE
jgi:hypothetical protein